MNYTTIALFHLRNDFNEVIQLNLDLFLKYTKINLH